MSCLYCFLFRFPFGTFPSCFVLLFTLLLFFSFHLFIFVRPNLFPVMSPLRNVTLRDVTIRTNGSIDNVYSKIGFDLIFLSFLENH
jgi:hypothetical protein